MAKKKQAKKAPKTVVLESADGRELWLQVNRVLYEGKEIEVPAAKAKQYRKLLEEAGYELK